MTCVELQRSLEQRADAGTSEQQDHLRSCPVCAALVDELSMIAARAVELRESHEPSPRVWNSIEIALRKEGLIRPQRASHSLLPALGSRWGWARWMAPVAAALLIAIGIYLRPHSRTEQVATNISPPASADMSVAGLSDDDFMQEIAAQAPDMQAQYTDNLQRVNQYIQDAKSSVDANPNDEEARRALMDAYQEKSMLFELALDRSLP